LGVIGVLVVIGLCSRQRGQPAAASAADPQPASIPSAASETLPKVSAATLVQTYKANEAAFDQKFKGKRIQVTGPVVAIKTGLGGSPTIWLVSEISPVVLKGHSAEWAATLNVGDQLTDKCEVELAALGTISLDCSR
jgi:hypothetical protein